MRVSLPFDLGFLAVDSSDPTITHSEGELAVGFHLDRSGRTAACYLRFEGLRAYRFTAEPLCVAEQIDGAYQTVRRVSNSAWLEQLRSARPRDVATNLSHFLVYLEDLGALEALATSVDWHEEATTD